MRIAFYGQMGAGKTTLLKRVRGTGDRGSGQQPYFYLVNDTFHTKGSHLSFV
jgi:ABC-type phosphate/phosphonate transport system ATPase subunit